MIPAAPDGRRKGRIVMIQIKNHNGTIGISENVFASIVGSVINNCYGVVGMASAGAKDGIVSLLKKDSYSRGIRVTSTESETLVIDIHIVVTYGVNLPVISRSIVKEVKYMVEKVSGFRVKKINVHIDAMKVN